MAMLKSFINLLRNLLQQVTRGHDNPPNGTHAHISVSHVLILLLLLSQLH